VKKFTKVPNLKQTC